MSLASSTLSCDSPQSSDYASQCSLRRSLAQPGQAKWAVGRAYDGTTLTLSPEGRTDRSSLEILLSLRYHGP